MINTLAQSIVNKYDNLPPKKKALADMFGLLLLMVVCTSVVAITVHFNLFMEAAILMLVYGIFGMIRILYQTRVSHYEFQEALNNSRK